MKTVNKTKSGLGRKITLMCLLMAAVVCAGACAVGYAAYRNSLYQTYNRFAYEVGDAALAYVDGNTVANYLDAMETDEAYEEMTRHIRVLYDNLELTSIYISVMDPEALTLTNIYDARIHDAPDPAPFALGAVDPISADAEDSVNVYLTGERSHNYFIRRSSFGYNTSAILPVKNDAGQVTAVLAVDVPMPNIIRDLNRYLLQTVMVTVLLGLLVLAAALGWLRRRVIAPIAALTANAERFAASRELQETLDIRTGDEVETLAHALSKMERDIIDYIDNLASVTAEKERIGAELSIATQIQADMLPSIFPAFPERGEFDIYAAMNPAKEVGGDFYDFFMVDERHLAIVMADVSGKGVPAALFMVIGKTLIKDHTHPNADLGEVFTQVNNLLCQSNREGMFITAFEGVLDLVTGRFNFVNAGHEIPFIAAGGQPFTPHKITAGFVLAGMEGVRYRCGSLKLSPGDKLFQYTDGVTEATDKDNRLYGMERLEQVLAENTRQSPQELLSSVKTDIDAFVGDAPQFDDITMLCLEFRHYMEDTP